VTSVRVAFSGGVLHTAASSSAWHNRRLAFALPLDLPHSVATLSAERLHFEIGRTRFSLPISLDSALHASATRERGPLLCPISYRCPPVGLPGVPFPLRWAAPPEALACRVEAGWRGSDPAIGTGLEGTIVLPPAGAGALSYVVSSEVELPEGSARTPRAELPVSVEAPFSVSSSSDLGGMRACAGLQFVCEVRVELAMPVPAVVLEAAVVAEDADARVCPLALPLALQRGEAFNLVVLMTPRAVDWERRPGAALVLRYTAAPCFEGVLVFSAPLAEFCVAEGAIAVDIDAPMHCSVGERVSVKLVVRDIARARHALRLEVGESGAFLADGLVKRSFVLEAGGEAELAVRFLPLRMGRHALPRIDIFRAGVKLWSAAPRVFVM
jgi:hypothetical protein